MQPRKERSEYMTPSQLNSRVSKTGFMFVLNLACALSFLLGLESSSLGEIQYFDQPDMDFWKKPGQKQDSKALLNPPPGQTKTPQSKEASSSSFPWKKYLDPKNEEFFREG